MADITQIQKYDTRPFPREERRRGALPAVVEAGVLQELLFLNSVYENVQEGILTQEQADIIMWMIDNTETLLSEAVDMVFTETAEPLTEILEDCVIDGFPISGTGVVNKKIIYESGKPESIYKPYGWGRVFGMETDPLAAKMNRRMNYLENEMTSYFESYGERGFEEDESRAYLESNDPDTEMFLKDYLCIVTEAATITGTISAENGVSILSFLEACMMDEAGVGAMAPVIPVTDDDVLTKNPDKKKNTFLLPGDSRTTEAVINSMLHEHGWYTIEAATVYKNNIAFDSVSRKLFNNLGSLLRMPNPNDPSESFKSSLNMQKNCYRWTFNDSTDPKINDTISAKILQTGFRPVKNNGKIVSYNMEKKPITIAVEFNDINGGIGVEYTSDATTESTSIDSGATFYTPVMSLEADNRLKDDLIAICESATTDSYMETSRASIENHSMLERLENIKFGWGDDATIINACDTLMAAMESSNDSVSEDDINTALSTIKDVVLIETACEAVLDAAEFTAEITEAASKEDIDPEIKPIIELLNRLGYKTKYSSAGYREERSKDDRDKNGVYYGKLYTTARITFDGNYKFDQLPKGWYQNFNSDKTGIYVKPFTYNEKDGSPDKAFAKWKEEYIDALRDWAENLKEAKDSKVEESD